MATAATATITTVPDWNPTTNGELELKASLVKLAASTDPVMLSPAAPSLTEMKAQEKQQKKFLLQSKAYFDLKAYVLSGQEFPQTDDEFDRKISKDAFKRLEAVDNSIYDDTKKTMVGIGGTCGAFYKNNLFQIVQAGAVAKTWTEATLENLQSKDAPAMSLYTQLMVLCDPKYKSAADLDAAFTSAQSAAGTQLEQLEKTAVDKSAEAKHIVTALLKFRTETSPFVERLKELIPKYTTTPVKFGKTTVNGYLAYLSADYADAVTKLSKALNDYNGKYDDWKTATGVAVGVGVSFGWFPIFGWAALAAVANNADNLHKAWENLWDNYNSLKSDNEKEAQLIAFATTIVGQFDKVDKKIKGAIDAVGTLSTMLQDQADAYSGINSTLQSLGAYTLSTDAGNRQLFIKYKLQVTIKKLEDLHAASQGFMEAILNEDPNFVKTITPS
ncbi:hypothetical protein LZ31DRAFT_580750 [Colletotrichum somersetense]|nr:hypothetical protein LZ31DRAFT_580750 [Colletotrichum somersetense]